MSKREPGLDLLRCFATLLVVITHSFTTNGYVLRAQVGTSMWIAGSIQLIARCGVGIFMILTGYLQAHKTDWRSCYRRLPSVILGYLLVAFISIPIRHFLYGDVQSLATWGQRLLGYSGAYYGWYVEVYVGLTLLSPFINAGLKNLSTRALLGFAAVLLYLTALPGVTPWVVVPGYWKALYPLCYYVLGAIIRRVQPNIKPWLALLTSLAVAFLMGAVTVLSTDGPFVDALTWDFGDLGMVVVTVGIFLGLYRTKLSPRLAQFFAFAATGSYGAYLLSHLLDAQCYQLVMPWRREGRFLLIFLCVTIPIYIVSMMMGIGLDKITHLLLKLGYKVADLIKKAYREKLPR